MFLYVLRTVGDEGAPVSRRRPVCPLLKEREHDVVLRVRVGRRGIDASEDGSGCVCWGMARYEGLGRGEDDV